MAFSGFNYIFVFLPVLLAVYFILPAGRRTARNAALLLFGLVFYACGGVYSLPLLLVSATANYGFALFADPQRPGSKAATAAAVAANLLALAMFKYTGFAAQTLTALGLNVTLPQIALPLGVSFFTFRGLSYILDVRRGLCEPERNYLRALLYLTFFPQLVSGPIARYPDMAEELRERHESLSGAAEGGVRFCFGLAKKLLLADTLGELASAVYATDASQLTVTAAWLGAVAYALQLYFDFSGYSDMAIGTARIFGFSTRENFNYPYCADSVSDFWRRWHISLSSWFRDYLYIPLGGNRRGTARQIFNLLVVWTLTGLWHGPAWNFVLWGLYYALLLIGERFLWRGLLEKSPRALRHIYALLIVIVGWVFFRADSAAFALGVLKAMFGGAPFADGRTIYYLKEYGILLAIGCAAALPVKQRLADFSRNTAPPPDSG